MKWAEIGNFVWERGQKLWFRSHVWMKKAAANSIRLQVHNKQRTYVHIYGSRKQYSVFTAYLDEFYLYVDIVF